MSTIISQASSSAIIQPVPFELVAVPDELRTCIIGRDVTNIYLKSVHGWQYVETVTSTSRTTPKNPYSADGRNPG